MGRAKSSGPNSSMFLTPRSMSHYHPGIEPVPMGDTEAFWATSAQIAVVLALALVLELRLAARRWKPDTHGKIIRRFQAAYYLVGGLLTFAAIHLALVVLLQREYVLAYLNAEQWFLSIALGFVILGPILDVMVGAYGDALIRALNQVPWSHSSRLRRKFDKLESALARDVEETLETLEKERVRLTEAKQTMDAIDAVIVAAQAIADNPAVPAAERTRAEAALTKARQFRTQSALFYTAMRAMNRRLEKALRRLLRSWALLETARDGIDTAIFAEGEDMLRSALNDIQGVSRELTEKPTTSA